MSHDHLYTLTCLRERIEELAQAYGSMRALGAALGIDHAYLQRLKSGEKTEPSDDVLAKLGLKRNVYYTKKVEYLKRVKP